LSGTDRWEQRRLHPRFGVELSGRAIGASDYGGQAAYLANAVHEHGVVVIRDQSLDDKSIFDLARSMGDVPTLNLLTGQPLTTFHISNLDGSGNIVPADDKSLRAGLANELWHTDSTYLRPRASISMLYGHVVPPAGGETQFCDTRCAYEDIDPSLRQRAEGLTAVHSLFHSRALIGFNDWTSEELTALPPVERPLVQLHRESGRMALCLASHIERLLPLRDSEGRAFLKSLMDSATRDGAIYSHRWRRGDLILWDNRCTMHRATPYNYEEYKRDMISIRLNDKEDQLLMN
jgi:alpha-ketoglutarate-dependent 2,4-dichlorophenoxyacetate dioxygenase